MSRLHFELRRRLSFALTFFIFVCINMAKRFAYKDLEGLLTSEDSFTESDENSDFGSDDFEESSEDEIRDEPSTTSDMWSFTPTAAREQFRFTGVPGVNISITDPDDVIGIFEQLSNDRIVELIAEETNKYSEKKIQEATDSPLGLRKKSRMRSWKPTIPGEIRLLEGMFLLMGIVNKPTIQSFFSTNFLIKTPIFNEIMVRDRFLLLLSFLHFTSNENKTSKLYKIEQLLDLFRCSFRSAYTPSRNVSIDESLLLWKGRLSWRIFIPMKRAKFGIETFLVCEANTGYVYNFIIYTGKGTEIPINLDDVDPSRESHSTNIVLSLMEEFLDQGYCLGIDNYYTSPDNYL
ncbi:piggyBac transposable element-derived protein 4-like [Centruroides sculpturatus]|uniref:piggyBac transposable element-derived protein 4-like n=1 Tax=Centruroides sculpturatus TaxID=218467 RepID=UPI000C6E8296|nr:piggyBac transposable element-derived protein 4-like [Centruroides sculpturatus]